MNHIYRLKRSARTLQLLPVPETARNASKGSSGVGKTLGAIVSNTLATFALSGIASLLHAQQAPPAVNQLPQGGVVTRGVANINTSTTSAGNALMTVNQSSQRAVIDWNSFNVGSQAKVQFNQPGSNAVVLNQILGNNASQIYGQISANGQVFLSNPNGVYFSPTAQVNVGGLVATTGKANVDDFMAGNTSFSRQGATGSVVNDGQLNAALGGYIALLAPEVRNQGVVVAQAGTAALASGEAITLNFNNSNTGLAGITTTPQTIAALVENRSAVLAEGGQIILSAHALASLQGSIVKNSGQLSASSLSDKGGKIVLMADSIALTSTSQIQASGATAGGTVLVGGDWQGSGDTRQATKVSMAQGASIEANATQNGDGGKVVLWSDVSNANSLTQVEGRIEAKGAGTGSGGQVETSGHTLQVGAQTQVNTGGGEWLLDPSDITISSGTTTDINYSVVSTINTYTPTSGVATSVVNASTLVGNLGSNNVTITTTNATTAGSGAGNITVAANLSWSSAYALTLTAAGGISGTGNISMTGATGTGLIFNQAGNSTYSGNISGTNAKLTKQGAGNLTLTGSNTYGGLTTVSAGTLKAGVSSAFGTGGITLSNDAALDLNGQTLTNSGTLTLVGTVLSGVGGLYNSNAAAATYNGPVTFNVGNNNFVKISATAGLINLNTITGVGNGTLMLGGGFGGVVNGRINTSVNTISIDSSSSWTFNAANTITSGTMNLNSGILKLGVTNALGSVSGDSPGTVTVMDGAALDLNGVSFTPTTAFVLNGAGVSKGTGTTGALFNSGNVASSMGNYLFLGSNSLIVADNGAINLTLTGYSATGKTSSSSTYSELTLAGSTGGLIAGGLNFTGLTKKGAGTWTLTGNQNTPVSASIITSIIGGTLQIGNGGNSGQVITGTAIIVSSGATLAYNLSAATTSLTNTITGTGTIANLAYGKSLNLSGANVTGFTGTYSAAFNETSQTMASIVLPSSPNLAGRTLSVSTFGSAATFADKAAITWTGTATDTPTLKLNGAVVSSSSADIGEFLTLSAANLSIRMGTAIWSLTNNGSTTFYATTMDATNSALVGSAIIKVRAGYSLIESGVLSGTGSLTVSGGTLTLAGPNTYSGGTFINGGTLQISSDANLGAVPGTAATNITLNGGTLNVSGQSAAVALSANRLISVGTSGGTITNGSSSYGLTINSEITSSGAVTLNGGDLTFGNITVSNNSEILVKSTGNITQSASSTVTSAGGNITYWADSDGSGAGGITLTLGTSPSNTKIISTNGTIVLGGGSGASASLGYARGDKGVYLQRYTQILGSNITIKGAGNTSASTDAGVYLDSNSIVSGDTVTVVGLGYANSIAGGTGVTDAGTISATTLASITGTGTGTAVTTGSGIANYGIVFSSATVEATGSGNVVINGTGGGDSSSTSINYGVIMSATPGLNSFIRSATGTVNVNATGGGGTTNTGFVTTTSGTGTITIGGTGQAGVITLNTNSMSQLGGIFSTPSLLILGSGSSNISLPLENVIGTVAGSGLGNVNINNAGALTVGTVGTTPGLSASGTVTVTTSTGNLTLANNITTTNTTASAIALDAGKTATVGDTTSGNLILSGGSISMGAGGLAMLYTGSVADSTGVTALVGSGSGNFRYGSTMSVTNYSTALGTSGVYAIYRERPSVSWTWNNTATPSLVYGVSPLVDTSALSGLVNGDAASPMTVRVVGTNALATLNASGYYNVGSYVLSRTTDAKALGYLTTDPTLTVTPAALTVTANDATKTYDGLAFSGGNGFSYSGFLTGDTATNSTSGSVSYTGTAQGAINATNGTPYTIIPSGLTSSNYAISYVNGGLTVNKAALTLTINNDARFLSESDAVGFGGASYSGFVAGQTSAVLGGALSVTRSARGPDGNTGGANTLAGTYTGALSGTGLTSSNYTIGYVAGNYTIVPANQLLVVLASTSANYGSTPIYSVTSAKYYHTGSAPVDLTSSVVLTGTSFTLNDGFNGNTAFTLGALSPSLSTSGNLNVGAYQLGATSISNTNGNYSNNLTVTGALQVNPKAITAAVTSGASKAYDGNNSMSGLALGLTGLMTNDVVTASGAGTFASKDVASPLAYSVANIALAGAASSNYVLTDSVSHLPSNTLTGTNGAIAAVQLTITGALQGTVSKVYDGTDVATLSSSNYLLTGWIGSDGATVMKTSGTYSDKNVSGSKTVTVSLSSSDYNATVGTALSNYVLPTSITGAVGTITRLSQVTWVGGSTGNWFDPANWAGGAVPDLSNVANVVIPTGVTVSFSNTVVAPAQAGAVNLVSIGTGGSLAISAGTLNVGSGGVALNTLTQSGGALSSTGDIAVANLSQTAGTLSAARLSTTTSFSQTGSGTITATGDIALGATNGPVTLGNLSTTGALSVTSTGGAIAQNAGTSMSVAGTSTFLASNLGIPADVTLANSGNTLIGTVTINGVTSGSGSSNASADPAPPAPGMTPSFVMSAPSYRVVMVKSPLDEDGLLRIEWVDSLADTEIELPTAMQEWIKLARPVVKAGTNGKNLPTSIKLSDDGSSLKLLATADLRLPANVVLQGKQGAMKIQVVKAH